MDFGLDSDSKLVLDLRGVVKAGISALVWTLASDGVRLANQTSFRFPDLRMLAGVCLRAFAPHGYACMHLPGLIRTSACGVVAGDAGGRLPGFGVQRQQGVDGLDLAVPGPSDAGGHLPGFGLGFSPWRGSR